MLRRNGIAGWVLLGLSSVSLPGLPALASVTECELALGFPYLADPLPIKEVPALARDYSVLRAEGEAIWAAHGYKPNFGPDKTEFAYRGMSLSMSDLTNVIRNGLELSRVRPSGRGRINLSMGIDIPMLTALGVREDRPHHQEPVLGVIIELKRAAIPNPVIVYSKIETEETVPASAISEIWIFDPTTRKFRPLKLYVRSP